MIKATVLINDIPTECEVEDCQTFGQFQKMALVKTLDGRQPFQTFTARIDPETPVYPVPTSWGWVDVSAILDVSECNAVTRRNLEPVYELVYPVMDDLRADLGL